MNTEISAAQPSATARVSENDPPTQASAAHAKARIVVIDDEPLNIAVLADFLHGAGYSRVARLSGDFITAQVLRDEQPDLLLLEMALNPARTFEVLEWMRTEATLRHVPVLVLADRNDLPSRLRALELGATEFLFKPIDPRELALRLHNTLATKVHCDELMLIDPLTRLPNREALRWRLDHELRYTMRHTCIGAVLHFGIDRFKQVNDALGPSTGDELLQAVATRLASGLRDTDTVALMTTGDDDAQLSRGNGDEFSVLLPRISRTQDAADVARRMIARMGEPFALAGHELFVTCRVGIAVFPGDGADRDTVLQHAGVAMRTARQNTRTHSDGIQFYSSELNAQSLHRIGLERELRRALERGEFRLHYQPQVDAASGQVCGAEALLRWQHPERGLLAPGGFIAVAENTRLIVPIGHWVLRESLKQLAQWRKAGMVLPQLSINVASQQLQRAELCDEVRAALLETGVAGTSLCLELTESALIESGPQVTASLKAIKTLVVTLALDDFGTGYSSLTYLRRFPIDELKIDRSFVTDCHSDANNSAITAAIIVMSHRLGLRVVAEGVETLREEEFIRANGADAYQGYLFSRPLAAADFAALMVRDRAAAMGAAVRYAEPATLA